MAGILTNPLKLFLARAGVPDKARDQDSVFDRKRSQEIPDLKRIADLPRRRWVEGIGELVDLLSDSFAVEAGSRPCDTSCVCRGAGSMRLLPVQAAALADLHDYRGLLGPIDVGEGKTLLSYLAGSVCEVDRVLLLVPSKLVSKTRKEFALYARHWLQTCEIEILSYELLSRERGLKALLDFAPQMVITDEAQKLKNPRAACTKRVARYMRDNPQTIYADLSGTQLARHLIELHHRMKWALPESLWPLPKRFDHCRELGYALDSKVPLGMRRAPGALMSLCAADEIADVASSSVRDVMLDAARAGFGRRYTETPGVVGAHTAADNLPGLTITGIPIEVPEMADHWHALRVLWETPSGEEIIEPVDVWRHAREMACGFFYYWDPAAPAPWREARSAWAKLVRDTLKYSRTYDTGLQVALAVSKGELGPEAKATHDTWIGLRSTFTPNPVASWVSDATIKFCAAWAAKNSGIIWVEQRAFGARLAKATGLPYYSNQGVDPLTGEFIEACESETCIASIESNKEGRNLQHKFSRNLITSCPTTGGTWQQLLGRTHRRGQDAEEVTVDVLISCKEQKEAFEQALADCSFQKNLQQQTQKLAIADVILDEVVDAALRGGPAWV